MVFVTDKPPPTAALSPEGIGEGKRNSHRSCDGLTRKNLRRIRQPENVFVAFVFGLALVIQFRRHTPFLRFCGFLLQAKRVWSSGLMAVTCWQLKADDAGKSPGRKGSAWVDSGIIEYLARPSSTLRHFELLNWASNAPSALTEEAGEWGEHDSNRR